MDRDALPAPEYAADADRCVASRTPVEEVLAETWADVPRMERGGGDRASSSQAATRQLITRLLSHVQSTFDPRLSIRTAFSMPTPEAMAEEIERGIHEDVAEVSEDEAAQLVESNPVAGA